MSDEEMSNLEAIVEDGEIPSLWLTRRLDRIEEALKGIEACVISIEGRAIIDRKSMERIEGKLDRLREREGGYNCSNCGDWMDDGRPAFSCTIGTTIGEFEPTWQQELVDRPISDEFKELGEQALDSMKGFVPDDKWAEKLGKEMADTPSDGESSIFPKWLRDRQDAPNNPLDGPVIPDDGRDAWQRMEEGRDSPSCTCRVGEDVGPCPAHPVIPIDLDKIK